MTHAQTPAQNPTPKPRPKPPLRAPLTTPAQNLQEVYADDREIRPMAKVGLE